MAFNQNQTYKRIGIVGAGNMGTMMSLGFAEQGLDVSLWDISNENVSQAINMAKEAQEKEKLLKGKIEGFRDIHDFANSMKGDKPAVYIFSITHGKPADSVMEKIWDYLTEGDIILDGGNEHYRNTERRQKALASENVHWVGMGVSGGYQSARRGPSMSPGGNKEAIEKVLPLLEKFAAKDPKSEKPCVAYIGPRGAGHFVKMVHNGIENGMLSTISEAWSIMHKSLRMPYDEIGEVFKKWDSTGELRDTYLVQIGSEICRTRKTPSGDKKGEGAGTAGFVLDDVLDKVVQDDDNSEGTGYWTVSEAALRHVAAPTIATGHFLRVASGNRDQRLRVAENLKILDNIPVPQEATQNIKKAFLEDLRRAVYASFLCSFCQGLELIARASKDESWDIDLGTCIRIWRAGCIIQAGHIADMLEPVFHSDNAQEQPIMNIKLIDEVSSVLHENFQPLKNVVLKAMEWDNYVPSLSASLEYVKYAGGTMLPTQFMEAEMDYFGAHSYDRPHANGEDPGKTEKGAHHYEWKPA
ncbi:6-phosphogluconate dehydrogenase C-terminal domain-like protein [Eremomyces bilateralis CBS 781.70]|uniref:phosphogluconate dehydrogenase (NADP(+)-dependent, decarboxylating) n=1 Tax=Eremomyces bilateralis CBS 781.70 TaxID=1392243 RepID=A0A6G1FWI5_9PEZI|nr:6-phosphogluconate dehydrogenase C-terminal domain-like protein [Eremomyces bilateralis CBS 781.70]KAF1810062.1 6-phosphogluconate dehydrogenase C-terminal domain-like protein [Eremomyces bilateralis CBS 781.70]